MNSKTLQINISEILRFTFLGVLILGCLPSQIFAHEKDSIFLPTIAIDEPTVGDELDIVYYKNKNKDDNQNSVHSHELGIELSKEIFPHFGISLGSNYQRLRLNDRFHSGFDDIEIGGKYEFYINKSQNFLLSLGLIAEIGKTGTKRVGVDSHTSIAPVLYFGKGLGNLSDEFKYLKPIVITGLVSPCYCTKASKIEDVDLGFAFQYQLRQLNMGTDNISTSNFLNYIVPVVEFPLSVCTTSGCRGKVIGSINPGVLFSGQYLQLGLEATLPINRRSGRNVGVLAQVHFFLDHLFE
jgi:hypothetical protein